MGSGTSRLTLSIPGPDHSYDNSSSGKENCGNKVTEASLQLIAVVSSKEISGVGTACTSNARVLLQPNSSVTTAE